MMFALDINEPAFGTEKVSSQGVTIESAILRFVIDSSE